MKVIKNNSNRPKNILKGTGDCVCRSVSTITKLPYKVIYNKLINIGVNKPEDGVYVKDQIKLMYKLGYYYVSCMKENRIDNKYLIENDLPNGRLVVVVDGHSTAVIDKTIYDTFNPNERYTRQIMGYFKRKIINKTPDINETK